MNIGTWQRVVALLVCTTCLATGCASLQNVPLRQSGQTIERPDVEVGDSVVVTTRSGEKQRFEVTAVGDDALVGRHARVAYADMSQLELRRSSDAGRKGLIIGAVVLGVTAIAAAAGGGGSGGGY